MSEEMVEISEESLMWIDERYNKLREENKRLHSIIKEVREYIELGMNFDSLGVARTKKKLLEILDKAGSDKK